MRFVCALLILAALSLLAWHAVDLTDNSLLPTILAPMLLVFYLAVSYGFWRRLDVPVEVKQAPSSMKPAYRLQLLVFRYVFCSPGYFVCVTLRDFFRLITANKRRHGTR